MKLDSDLEAKLAKVLASWFGCGKAPWAPGTVGALGAVPLFLVLKRLHPIAYAAATLGVSVAGIWASQKTADALGEKDPSSVVIDEVAGVLIALGLVARRGPGAQALAWVLFRAFDIAKPGPIDDLQHLRPAGLGIMADDLAAGALAGVVARLLSRP
ncbi:MAG: phosphatidylglycerophosphatase A [Myxococcales bacterium]|jgi:phosphatidylglycerophosphatase A|nr:phosphatidylglycerophosphatase A [Myxococcales bacterium]